MLFLDNIHILLTIGLGLSLIFYAWASQLLWHIFDGSQKNTSLGAVLLHLAAMTPIPVMSFINIPLPLFYILIYGITCFVPVLAKKKKSNGLLLANVRFLIFAAPHLIIIGVQALEFNTDVRSVLDNCVLRMAGLVIAAALSAAASYFLSRYLGKDGLGAAANDLPELHFFSRFVWFCVCSVVIDGIPCMFALPTKFSSLFLIGCNILLLLMALIFGSYVYTIMRSAHVKEEYLRLREEETVQHNRTVLLEHEAYLDSLTGIYTRSYVMTNVTNMLKNGESFALAFIDLDGLKKINDQQGHMAGDRYLQEFAVCVKEKLHINNIFARYGGDEFLLLMPGCSMEEAAEQLRKIQKDVSVSGFPFSCGAVWAWPEDGRSAEEWIAEADRIMYEDKKRRKVHKRGDCNECG